MNPGASDTAADSLLEIFTSTIIKTHSSFNPATSCYIDQVTLDPITNLYLITALTHKIFTTCSITTST